MAKELELKLSIVDMNAESVEKGLGVLAREIGIDFVFTSKELKNTYFDTPALNLNKSKMALRIRDTGRSYIQTLKTKGQSKDGLSERGEWEWELADKELNCTYIEALEVWPSDTDTNNLIAVFETNFTRRECLIRFGESDIELAYDRGEVCYLKYVSSINELELELKRGDVNDLLSLGELFKTKLNVVPSDISKAERGYQLFLANK